MATAVRSTSNLLSASSLAGSGTSSVLTMGTKISSTLIVHCNITTNGSSGALVRIQVSADNTTWRTIRSWRTIFTTTSGPNADGHQSVSVELPDDVLYARVAHGSFSGAGTLNVDAHNTDSIG